MSAKAVREHYGKTLLARHLSEHTLYVTEGTLHLAVSVPSGNSGPLRLVRCCENLDGVMQTVAET